MGIFDRYIFKNLLIATLFVAVILAVVIFLTQSLRFLELVIEAGASGSAFWMLTFLAMPRFLEIILPLALVAAILFIYNRMINDSELIVIKAVGYNPARLARPAIILAIFCTIFMMGVSMWGAPKALSGLQQMRQIIKTQFSTLIFREGIFNKPTDGLMVYVREKGTDSSFGGLMIYDTRDLDAGPSTTVAKRGTLLADENGYEVLVYDGSRQQYDPERRTLERLNFERYSIDLPENDPVYNRWREPDERTIFELLAPNPDSERDLESLRDFNVEIHRRIVTPFMALVFTVIAVSALLVGPLDRRGQGRRIIFVIAIVVVIQGFYIGSYNLARQSDFGFIMMYLLAFMPLITGFFFLSGISEKVRRNILYRSSGKKEVAS